MMAVCCCSLAGTAACQHCRNNPMATDVWTNKTVTVDHIDAKPFGNGLDVCPVCGKPITIGKPQMMYDELIAKLRYLARVYSVCENENTQEYKLAVQAANAIEELQKRVPTKPHGDLIDTNDVQSAIDCWLIDEDDATIQDYKDAIGEILESPTVVPAEEGE